MKTEEEKGRKGEEEIDFLSVIDGELVETSPAGIDLSDDEQQTVVSAKNKIAETKARSPKPEKQIQNPKSKIQNQKTYLLLPFVFLTVTLLGGLRLSSPANAFIFWRPALFCLISAAILMVLFFRARLISVDGWFSEDFPTLQNVANGAVMVTLFAASAQIFNALLPEQGLPFWVFAFCFFWTLWNNLFADFDVKKLLRSLGALFGLAFVVKYLLLANLAAPASESWLQGIFQNPTKEAFTWLFDLPRFSAGTGYIQFFTVAFYLLGLFLLPNSTGSKR
ncbi:MAG TPA: hypothetical protein VNB22_10200 [Pyrinomonadaceae bacterium]|nr:hypothetical protein [Pyrinomonadaceae bacterium]